MTTETPRWPSVGERLSHYSRKTGETVEAEVLEVDQASGRIRLRVNGEEYPSLSAAAHALAGHATNGWVYWGLKKQTPRPRPKSV